jgi:hypothetical protein
VDVVCYGTVTQAATLHRSIEYGTRTLVRRIREVFKHHVPIRHPAVQIILIMSGETSPEFGFVVDRKLETTRDIACMADGTGVQFVNRELWYHHMRKLKPQQNQDLHPQLNSH